MTTTEISAVVPLLSIAAYHGLKSFVAWLHRRNANRRVAKDLSR